MRPAFEDLLQRLQTDYIDLGMIHYVDSEQDWAQIQHSDYLDYIMGLKRPVSSAILASAPITRRSQSWLRSPVMSR